MRRAGWGSDLEVAAEAVSLEVALSVFVELHLVLLCDGVPQDDATLGH